MCGHNRVSSLQGVLSCPYSGVFSQFTPNKVYSVHSVHACQCLDGSCLYTETCLYTLVCTSLSVHPCMYYSYTTCPHSWYPHSHNIFCLHHLHHTIQLCILITVISHVLFLYFRSCHGAHGVQQRSSNAYADAGASRPYGAADSRRERLSDARHSVSSASRHANTATSRILCKYHASLLFTILVERRTCPGVTTRVL